MTKPAIIDKQQMYRLYAAGVLGNKPRFWASPSAYHCSDFHGACGVRCKVAGGPCVYDLDGYEAVMYTILDLVALGWKDSDFIIQEMAPHYMGTIQGEIVQSTEHISLVYTDVKKPMRIALAEKTLYADGLRAVMLLRHYLDATSYEHVQGLLSDYPDHVVEFTAFDRGVGDLGLNTIVWELRKY